MEYKSMKTLQELEEKIMLYEKIAEETPSKKEERKSLIILIFILTLSFLTFILYYGQNYQDNLLKETNIPAVKTNEHKILNKHNITLDIMDFNTNLNKINEIQKRDEKTESKVILSLIENRDAHIKNFLYQKFLSEKTTLKFHEIVKNSTKHNDGRRHLNILKDEYKELETKIQAEYNHILEFDNLIVNLLGTSDSELVKIKKKFPTPSKELSNKW